MFAIIKNNRKGLEKYIFKFLNINKIDYIIVDQNTSIEDKVSLLEKKNVKILFFSNGTDICDQEFINYLKLLNKYENYKCYFSEYGWLPWKGTIYLLEEIKTGTATKNSQGREGG